MSNCNTNRGLIWLNRRKTKDTNPDYTGSLNVKGEEFWISAWKQKDNNTSGVETLSFSVRPKNKTLKEQPKDYVINNDSQSGDLV